MPLRIAIALGDFTGIGPEVTLKALASLPSSDNTQYILIGGSGQTRELARQLKLDLDLIPWAEKTGTERIVLHDPLPGPLPSGLTPGSPAAAQAAITFLREGARGALHHEYDALVTAPVNKESVVRAGVPFIGQTEFLAELAGVHRSVMMLLGKDDRGQWLRVALATTHVALKLVSDHLTRERIELAIQLAVQACRDLGLPRARIGVCGLNPHAGEGGQMGTEEQTTIGPVVTEMQRLQLDVTGPLSADALFYYAYRGDYDAVVAMYHDQGLAPLKMVAFEQGVNWTLGLPFIRTSPDHGTAYDIAGRGIANPSSMLAAIGLARQLAARKG